MIELAEVYDGLIYMGLMSVVIALLYIFLLRWMTKPLLYISILVIMICFVVFAYFCYTESQNYKKAEDELYEQKWKGVEPKPEMEYSNNYFYSFYGAIVLGVLAVVYALCICCCWNNIALGASIMETASEFVSETLRVLLIPPLAYIICMVFLTFWLYTAVHLYSIGEPEFRENQFIANIKWTDQQFYIMWYYLFGLFWVTAFFICLQQFIIASITCMWYFSGGGADDGDDAGNSVSIFKAIGWGCFYHLGSIAFGSFLIAVITLIRVIFEYIAKKYEAVGNKDNAVYKAVSCCIRCCLWCLDKYVKFITKNAFIQIALSNKSFCPAAFSAFYLMIRHAGRFGSATIIGWMLMFLGKGCIVASSAYISYMFFMMQYPQLTQPLIPAVIVAIIAYLVGSLFMSVFTFSSTTILHSFILDEDTGASRNTPSGLRSFMDENDKANNYHPEKKKQ